ncbi:MAG: NADH-quinone oxidoreductase subunit J, partial [Actinomycetota bacterium]
MTTQLVLFWVMAPISVGSAIAMLLQRSAIYAALLLVVNFFTLGVFYLMLDAPFLFAVQIIVYAGAIMVLFLFVIMLLGVDRKESLIERLPAQRPLAVLFGILVAAERIGRRK